MIATGFRNRLQGDLIEVTESHLKIIDEIILDAEDKLADGSDIKNPLDAMTTSVNLLKSKYESLEAERRALETCTKYAKPKVPYQLDRVRDVIRECIELSFEVELEIASYKARLEAKQ